ncbi:MAG: hypothetical protein U0136_19155 [Bdellovibrionota bacterium]
MDRQDNNTISMVTLMSRASVLRIVSLLIVALLSGPLLAVAPCLADELEILSPDTGDRVVEELAPDETAELVIYLKSFGDLVGGYRVTVLDDQGRQVGKNISDMFGVAKFTNMPAGRYRISVEKNRVNERGGPSTVSVGDLRVTKIRK